MIKIRPFLSIIIPVYNAEKYLPACLESVINQTEKSIEIIVIDDGSTDNGLAIIKKYAKKDDRIVVISQENSGVSSSRNTGIRSAKGIYTWFIDADDWIELKSVKLLKTVAEANQYDAILFSFALVDVDGEVLHNASGMLADNYRFNQNSREEILKNIINGRLCTIWRSIYRTDFIKNQQLFFDETLHTAEDVLYSYQILVRCENGIFIDHCLYYHRKTPYSLTHTFYRDEFTNTLRARTLVSMGIEPLMRECQFAQKRVVTSTILSINYIMRLFYEYRETHKKERFATLEDILNYDYFQDFAWKASYKELGFIYKIELWLARRKMARTIWFLNTILFSSLAMMINRLIGTRWIKSIHETQSS
ncbi:MAG: glycosyltransferase [Syntrophomonadaceae bacterium]